MNWFDRRDDADEYADADIDPFTEASLAPYVRPGEPGDRFRELTYGTVRPCRTCLHDVAGGEACEQCGRVQPWKAEEAA